VDYYLPCFRQRLITCPLSALLPFQSLFTESSSRDHVLAPPPFLSVLRAHCPFCCGFLFSSCLLFQFFLFFVFLQGGSQSFLGLCWFNPSGICGISHAAYLLTYWSVSPEQFWSGCLVAGNHLFSQCNMSWAWGSGCQSFDSSSFFFFAKCCSCISANFFIYGAHAVCFYPLVAIFDHLTNYFLETRILSHFAFILYSTLFFNKHNSVNSSRFCKS
jgi:hypothetical protein